MTFHKKIPGLWNLPYPWMLPSTAGCLVLSPMLEKNAGPSITNLFLHVDNFCIVVYQIWLTFLIKKKQLSLWSPILKNKKAQKQGDFFF